MTVEASCSSTEADTLSAIRCTDQAQAAQVRDVGPVKIARHPDPTFGDEFA